MQNKIPSAVVAVPNYLPLGAQASRPQMDWARSEAAKAAAMKAANDAADTTAKLPLSGRADGDAV